MYNPRHIAAFVAAGFGRLPPVLSLLAIVAALTTGCKCTAVSNHAWVGFRPPKIDCPEEISQHLRQTVNGEGGKCSHVAGMFTTPFKRLGIVGWTDLGYDGEIIASVRQAAKSSDKFYTVDMKLESLHIDGRKMPLVGDRYLRAEICLCDVALNEREMPRVGDRVWMRGRMVWDGDGFVEIHPRSAAEVGQASLAKRMR